MGKRKHQRAEELKEQRKNTYYSKLTNYPSSPRKMRLVADLIKGQKVESALNILTYTPQAAAEPLKKLLITAIASWEQKNEDTNVTESDLFVKNVIVDQSKTLKRIQPRAQGRAFRIRKRSSHVTIYLDTIKTEESKQN